MSNTKRAVLHSERKERCSNMELLRIIATLFVVMIHYNNSSATGGKAFGYTEALPVHHHILLVFEMMAICAVNIFVMISGYFLCTSTHVRISKILRLYIDVIFFAVLRYILSCILGESTFYSVNFLQCFIPLNWYVAVYSGLYLISPYLNRILQNWNRSQFRFMLMVFFFVLSVWPSAVEFLSKVLKFSPTSLSPISNQGSLDGYTLVNFILLYFLGAYCRICAGEDASGKKRLYAALVFFGCTALNTLYAHFFVGRATSYCNPLVIIQTVSVFVFFQNVTIQSKAINSVAGCAFGVYLMHTFFFPYCRIEQYVTGNPVLIPIHIIVSSMLIYSASALIYWGYQKLFAPLFALVESKCCFLSYDISGFHR